MGKYVRISVCLGILLLVGVAGWIWLALRAAASEPASVSGILASAGGSAPAASEAFSLGIVFSPPEGVDLDVTYIGRAPLYSSYCVEYLHDAPNQPGRPILCPGTENDRRWPEPGEIVTFTAHIANKGTLISPPFDYDWHVDGSWVASGTLPPLEAGHEVTATIQLPWPNDLTDDGQRALGEHTVRFTADSTDAVDETYETNNSLEDRTDAMSFSIYLTPEMYAAYTIPVTDTLPYSAEDWLQKQIAAMNANFANAVYPATPQGSSLRVRINTIGIAAAHPGGDGQHDGTWFVEGDYRHGASGYYDPVTDIDWGMVHELGHQVSIIDLYAIGVYAANVFPLGEDGLPANVGFGWSNGGLMGGGDIAPYTDHNRYSSHTAGGTATYAGYRNGYFGSYLFDIPLNNSLRILDSQGNPASGVQVALYQRAGPWDWTGHLGVDSTPEISGTTDGSGLFALPNRSANGGTVTANGHTLHDNPYGVVDIIGNQGLFLIRLTRDGHQEFHWLDITQFNLAYWLGDVTSHTFTLSSHLPPPGAPLAPEPTAVRIEGTWASLDWQPSPSPGVVGYRVYRASAPQYAYVAASDLLAGTHFEEFSAEFDDGEHRIYAVTAVDGTGRESGFGELIYAPGLGDPVAVALAPDGSRMILNNWNRYPLLRQQQDGRYTHRLVNVHYDLGETHYLASDEAGRLWVSGFGEFPDSRPAVRVYDSSMNPLRAFGDVGIGAGQFLAPAGIALREQACTYGGPYQTDGHTLLLLHFEGNTSGEQGEPGTGSGLTFEPGRYGQGVLIDAADMLSYTTESNLNLNVGTLEFWVRPAWSGDDGQNHIFFEMGQAWNNGLRLYKEGTSRLRFMLWDNTAEYGIDHMVADWQAGEWHHIAVTWKAPQIALYVDGQQVAISSQAGVPAELPQWLFIGSNQHWPGQRADAVMDELRISDLPRLGNSDSCGRVLVADSGNARLQAFDMLGNLLSTYGSPGSGQGQFNGPQGLALDRDGRVIVADQGNDRLVLLTLDGTEFGYLDSFTAGFMGPTGVAVDAWGHIVVADTGNNRVVALDAEGNFLAEYTEPNDGYFGPFNAPRGVAVEPDGDLVVADTGNHRVVTVRGALPGHWSLWLPLVSHGASLGSEVIR